MHHSSDTAPTDVAALAQGSSFTLDALLRLGENRLALVSAGFLVLVTMIALITPWMAPYESQEQDLLLGASAPSAEHWLGTDTHGRDQFTRILYGSRISLMVGFVATAVALGIGVLWGATAGYLGGRVRSEERRVGKEGGW